MRIFAVGLLPCLLAAACASQNVIPGTSVPRTEENQAILDMIEEYRVRLREKNVEGLLVLASERYREDAGTPRPDDDYGYEGLKQILVTRLNRVRSLRYDIEYRTVRVRGNTAEVEVFLNGAVELMAETGDRYRRITDNHRFVLERAANGKWKFLSGM